MILHRAYPGTDKDIILDCSDLSNKVPHRPVGMAMVMTSGSLGWIMVSTLAWNARGGGFEFCSMFNISHFDHPRDTII